MKKQKISRKKAQADRLRKKHANYKWGAWTPDKMSNRQVIKVLGILEKKKE